MQSSEKLSRLADMSILMFHFEQRDVSNQAVDAILPGISTKHIHNARGTRLANTQLLFFLDAPGENWETFVTSAVNRSLKCLIKRILAAASSAGTAQLCDRVITTHYALKSTYSSSSRKYLHLRGKFTAFWRPKAHWAHLMEINLHTHHYNAEAVDLTCQYILHSKLPFGGIVTLCIDDFRKIFPGVWAGSQSQVMSAFFEFFDSPHFSKRYCLTKTCVYKLSGMIQIGFWQHYSFLHIF